MTNVSFLNTLGTIKSISHSYSRLSYHLVMRSFINLRLFCCEANFVSNIRTVLQVQLAIAVVSLWCFVILFYWYIPVSSPYLHNACSCWRATCIRQILRTLFFRQWHRGLTCEQDGVATWNRAKEIVRNCLCWTFCFWICHLQPSIRAVS